MPGASVDQFEFQTDQFWHQKDLLLELSTPEYSFQEQKKLNLSCIIIMYLCKMETIIKKNYAYTFHLLNDDDVINNNNLLLLLLLLLLY